MPGCVMYDELSSTGRYHANDTSQPVRESKRDLSKNHVRPSVRRDDLAGYAPYFKEGLDHGYGLLSFRKEE